MIPGLQEPIGEVDKLEKLRTDGSNKGKTFEVTKSVFLHYTKNLRHKPVSKRELEELNKLLSARIPDSKRPALSRSCSCPNCGHDFTFSDFVRSALSQSAHSKDQLKGFLTGPRFYLTIDTDAKRTLECPKCKNVFPGVFCCYTTGSYAYV